MLVHKRGTGGVCEQQRTLAYGIVMLLPRLLRASMGVEPCTPPTRLPPVDAGVIEPVGPAVGTPASKRPPPRKGSELGLTEAAIGGCARKRG